MGPDGRQAIIPELQSWPLWTLGSQAKLPPLVSFPWPRRSAAISPPLRSASSRSQPPNVDLGCGSPSKRPTSPSLAVHGLEDEGDVSSKVHPALQGFEDQLGCLPPNGTLFLFHLLFLPEHWSMPPRNPPWSSLLCTPAARPLHSTACKTLAA